MTVFDPASTEPIVVEEAEAAPLAPVVKVGKKFRVAPSDTLLQKYCVKVVAPSNRYPAAQ